MKKQKNNFKLILGSFLRFIPSKLYLKIVYRFKTGRKINFKNPVGFNEKLNWLKINNRDSRLEKYVDKISARQIVADKIGSKYLIPILGEWSSFDDIDFDALPDSFVLKCNHDSGSVKIIKNKKELSNEDIKKMRKFFNKRLKLNLYWHSREYPYLNIKPKIFAEKFMIDEEQKELKDYKFFCFDGVPKLFYVAKNRDTETTFDFYDMDCNSLNIVNTHSNSNQKLSGKPPHFDEMVNIVKQLCGGFPFIRIDLYSTPDGPLFSEFTFFHCGGFYLFHPEEWETRLGSWLEIK